jgi:hypothetical protein
MTWKTWTGTSGMEIAAVVWNLRVKCGDWLRGREVIEYKIEIGNFGYFTSTIRKIVLEDENPLKLEGWGFAWYQRSLIQKLRIMVNGRLEDNPRVEL